MSLHRRSSRTALVIVCVLGLGLGLGSTSASASRRRPAHVLRYRAAFETSMRTARAVARSSSQRSAAAPVLDNFTLVGHSDLGLTDSNGDVWVHDDYAYVGTWADPCTGEGVKVIDVSDPANPTLIGRVAGIPGTSAEDVVVRSVATPSFTGDLLAAGIQRCDYEDTDLDDDVFGVDLWDVTDPTQPVHLAHHGVSEGGGGTHELDLFQRGAEVYALSAAPFSEWFDPNGAPDVQIIDVTDPTAPQAVGAWGARAEGLSTGPYSGQGEFNSLFAHSARASADGTLAYVSYWDLGVVTLDISDVTAPTMLSHTMYAPSDEGNAHSVVPYTVGGRTFLLQNDEDGDPKAMATIGDAGGELGLAVESIFTPALFDEPDHEVRGRVVGADHQGCDRDDYEGLRVNGAIAVVRTYQTLFDPPAAKDPACRERKQDRVAVRLGAIAVVHRTISENTTPSWFDFSDVPVPVLYTENAVGKAMISSGRVTVTANEPTWGFLRVYDAATGQQVAAFDDLPHVHGEVNHHAIWMVHNTEVLGDHAFSAWYSHGIVALDLAPLAATTPGDPTLLGQFVPEAVPGGPFGDAPAVWGVYPRASDGLIFASDIGSGLWIVQPTGPAAP